MTQRAKQLLATMRRSTGLTQAQFARLTGRAEATVSHHENQGVIPATFSEWLARVREIRTESGQAVIVIDMPFATPSGEYRRAAIVSTKNGVPTEKTDTP